MKIFLLITLIFTSTTGCSSFLYQPARPYAINPKKIPSAPEEITFKSQDGTLLSGWYFHHKKSKKPKGVIVFFHGNAENLSTHFATLYWVLDHGYDYFIFDYQGYGRSLGKPSPHATLQDGKAAVCWAFKHNPHVPLIIFGQSLGGAIGLRTALEIKDKIPLAAVTLDSTFLSYKKVARSVLSQHWVTWPLQPLAYFLMSDRYAPGKRVGELSPIPLLVFHGDQDQVVPYRLGQEIKKWAHEPKKFITIPGGRHGDGFWKHGGKFRQEWLRWLHQTLPAWKPSSKEIASGLSFCSEPPLHSW